VKKKNGKKGGERGTGRTNEEEWPSLPENNEKGSDNGTPTPNLGEKIKGRQGKKVLGLKGRGEPDEVEWDGEIVRKRTVGSI